MSSRVILFDQDETLVYTLNARKEATQVMVEYLSERIGIPPSELEKSYNQALRTLEHIRFLPWDSIQQRETQIQYFLLLHGISDENLAKNLTDVYFQARVRKTRLLENAAQTVEALSRRGYDLGVTTDGNPHIQPEILDRLGISRWLNLGVFSRDYGYKVNTDFFKNIVKKIGRQPNEVGHVGDDITIDILIPRESGLHPCILFDRNDSHPRLVGRLSPDYRITSLTQLLDIFN